MGLSARDGEGKGVMPQSGGDRGQAPPSADLIGSLLAEQGDGWTLFSTDIQRESNGDTASHSAVHTTERKLPTALSSMWQTEIPTCWRLSLSPRRCLLLGLPA